MFFGMTFQTPKQPSLIHRLILLHPSEDSSAKWDNLPVLLFRDSRQAITRPPDFSHPFSQPRSDNSSCFLTPNCIEGYRELPEGRQAARSKEQVSCLEWNRVGMLPVPIPELPEWLDTSKHCFCSRGNDDFSSLSTSCRFYQAPVIMFVW